MPTYTKAAVAGNAQCWLGFIDGNGFMVGSATTAPSSGAAGSPMIKLVGIKEAPAAVPEAEVVQSTGDDDLIAEFDFTNTQSRSFVAEFAVDGDPGVLIPGTEAPVDALRTGFEAWLNEGGLYAAWKAAYAVVNAPVGDVDTSPVADPKD